MGKTYRKGPVGTEPAATSRALKPPYAVFTIQDLIFLLPYNIREMTTAALTDLYNLQLDGSSDSHSSYPCLESLNAWQKCVSL